MTDRELLELAAKAAGVVNYTFHDGVFQPKCLFIETGSRRSDQGYYWSPLTDDGDALRLAVKLRISIAEYGNCYARAYSPIIGGVGRFHNAENDLQEAVRCAIVKVAADIGSGM